MLFEGTLSRCIDFLAQIEASSWATQYVVIHVPAWHCYCVCEIGNPYQNIPVPDQSGSRVIFSGSVTEMAHFVLCPALTLHVTRHSLPELPDNEPRAAYPGQPDNAEITKTTPPAPPETNNGNGDGGPGDVNTA